MSRDGVEMDLKVRPRWGTMSVKSHMDANGVAMDLLLYDKLVFPVPADEDQADDWDEAGWDTEVLSTRLVQLTPKRAHRVVWDEQLRQDWQRLMDQRDDPNDPDAPYAFTERVIVEMTLKTTASAEELAVLDGVPERFAASGDTGGGVIGELIAGHHDTKRARKLWGLPPEEEDEPADRYEGEPIQEGWLLDLMLACPVDVGQERSLHQALELVEDDDFNISRRNLWAWEQQFEEEGYSPEEAEVALLQLAEDYNRRVEEGFTETVRRNVLYAAPIAAGFAIHLAITGVAGKVAGVAAPVVIDRIKAQFPQVDDEHGDVSHHPGSAIRGALSVLAYNKE